MPTELTTAPKNSCGRGGTGSGRRMNMHPGQTTCKAGHAGRQVRRCCRRRRHHHLRELRWRLPPLLPSTCTWRSPDQQSSCPIRASPSRDLKARATGCRSRCRPLQTDVEEGDTSHDPQMAPRRRQHRHRHRYPALCLRAKMCTGRRTCTCPFQSRCTASSHSWMAPLPHHPLTTLPAIRSSSSSSRCS